MHLYRSWHFYLPDTKRIQESDTAQFFSQDPLPALSITTQIAASMESIKHALNDHNQPILTEVSNCAEHSCADIVINKLREMFNGPHRSNMHHRAEFAGAQSWTVTHTRVETPTELSNKPKDGTPRRVQESVNHNKGMNYYEPQKKQQFPFRMPVRIVEKEGWKTRDVYRDSNRIQNDDGNLPYRLRQQQIGRHQ